MEKIDKIILEAICKFYLVDCLNETKFRDNDDLKKYIIYNMTYEQTLLATFEREFILTEGASAKEVTSIQRKANAVEQQLGPIVNISLAIAAGGKFLRPATALATKYAGIGGAIVGTLAGGIAISAGSALLIKLTRYMIMKYLSPCYKSCSKQFPQSGIRKLINTAEHGLCQANCRIKAYTEVLARLRKDRTKCPLTGNSNKCSMNINKQIIKYQGMLEKSKIISKNIKIN